MNEPLFANAVLEPTRPSAPTPTEPTRSSELLPPVALRRRADRLLHQREEREKQSLQLAHDFAELNAYLAIADQVSAALEQLNEQLFRQVLSVVEEKLTIALQEIINQPIALKAEADFQRGAAAVQFHIEREGKQEDVLRGQGGSVANILSVGLRMFALATLDPQVHRRFLVLDEQDCWLRPELVPKLVKIVRDAGAALGFQTLMISHHDLDEFRALADKIYRFAPQAGGGVKAEVVSAGAVEVDPG